MKVIEVPPLSWDDIQRIAHNVLFQSGQKHALEGKDSVDIERIFELTVPKRLQARGIDFSTGYENLAEFSKTIEFLGYTNAEQGVAFVDHSIFSDIKSKKRRGRATAGHESGHCLLHVPFLKQFTSFVSSKEAMLYRVSRNKLLAYKDPEWQAWAFASSILMPAPAVKSLMKEGMDEYEMANHFDVNPAFMRFRLGNKPIKMTTAAVQMRS